MVLSVSLSPKAQAKLKKRAAAAGMNLTEFASGLLEQAVARPSLQELLAPSQADFAKTGKTRKQVMEMGRRIVRRVRGAKGE